MGRRTSGGTYPSDDLRAAGVDASKAGGEARIYPEDLTVFDDPEHPLFEPRALWPLDEGFLEALRAGDVLPIVTVRRNGATELQIVDGTRTTLHLRKINEGFVAEGKKPLRALVRFFEGDDRAFLLARLRLNSNRADDTAGTLSVKFKQAEREGASHEEIAASVRGMSPRLVADLLRYPSFTKKVQRALDGGLPLECASAFAGVVREDQDVVLETVVAQLPDVTKVSPQRVRAAVKKVKASNGANGANGAGRVLPEGEDATPRGRAFSKKVLKRWADALERVHDLPEKVLVHTACAVDVLRIALGEAPLPLEDEVLCQTLAEAGVKEAKAAWKRRLHQEDAQQGRNIVRRETRIHTREGV